MKKGRGAAWGRKEGGNAKDDSSVSESNVLSQAAPAAAPSPPSTDNVQLFSPPSFPSTSPFFSLSNLPQSPFPPLVKPPSPSFPPP